MMLNRKLYLGVVLTLFAFTACSTQGSQKSQVDFSRLKVPYLGQKPPGLIPEVFAPGIISTEKEELNSVFSSDGKEFFFVRIEDDAGIIAVQALLKFCHAATGLELMPGVVAVIRTFGDRINFHPHIHVLMIEGGAAPDGAFHRVSRFHDQVIQEIFTHLGFDIPTSGSQRVEIEKNYKRFVTSSKRKFL